MNTHWHTHYTPSFHHVFITHTDYTKDVTSVGLPAYPDENEPKRRERVCEREGEREAEREKKKN